MSTATPWFVTLTPTVVAHRGPLDVLRKVAVCEDPDDARAIAACVNALAGVPIERLERAVRDCRSDRHRLLAIAAILDDESLHH